MFNVDVITKAIVSVLGVGIVVVGIMPFLYQQDDRTREYELIEEMESLYEKYLEVVPECYDGNLGKCNYADRLLDDMTELNFEWMRIISSR